MRSHCFCSRIKDPSCLSINSDPGRYGSGSKESACNAGDAGLIPGPGISPGEGNGNLSSILAWEITWTEEPGGLQFTGLQRVRND